VKNAATTAASTASAGMSWQTGTPVLGSQEVTEVLGPALVLDDHLVPALTAGHNPVQERLAGARNPARLVPIIFGVVVLQHGLDPHKRLPFNVRRVAVVDPDTPLVEGQVLGRVVRQRRARVQGARTPVDEGSGIRRVFQGGEDSRDRRPLPDHIAKAVMSGQQQPLGVEVLQHFAGRAALQEGGEDQAHAVLHLAIRIL